jgi:hypothetical protein
MSVVKNWGAIWRIMRFLEFIRRPLRDPAKAPICHWP